MEKFLIGYDIGGTKLGIGIGTSEGKIIDSCRIPNRNTDPNVILPQMVAETKRMIEQAGMKIEDFAAFGISAPFPADAAKGIMTKPVNNPLWRNVPILDYLKTNLGIPGCFENDANCGALAEWMFGAGKNCDNMIYLTLSTGIGGGIIANGQLIRGGKYLSAGEMGHICIERNGRLCSCGMKGCYEAYAGGAAVAARVKEEIADHPDSLINSLCNNNIDSIDMLIIEKAVRANDSYAMSIWEDMSIANAQAFGIFINTFNPDKIVMGTLAWAVGDLYTDPIKKYLPEYCWKEALANCELVCSQLQREISSYAGIAAALNYVREKNI